MVVGVGERIRVIRLGRKAGIKSPKKGAKLFEITSEVLDKIETLASQGMAQYQIAECLGISNTTFFDKKATDASFFAAYKKGQARGLEIVTAALLKNIEIGKEASTFFYLCNRDRENWKHVSKAGEDVGDKEKLTAVLNKMLDKLPD